MTFTATSVDGRMNLMPGVQYRLVYDYASQPRWVLQEPLQVLSCGTLAATAVVNIGKRLG